MPAASNYLGPVVVVAAMNIATLVSLALGDLGVYEAAAFAA